SCLPYESDHFAAAIHTARLLAAHDALGRRQDHEPQAAHAFRDITFRRVDAQTRPADAPQIVDDALAVVAVLEGQPDEIARLGRHHFKVFDKAFCFEQLGDLFFEL